MNTNKLSSCIQASINQQDVKRTAFPLPSLDEQEAIVEVVDDQLSIVDHLEADIDAKLQSAQALRRSILRDAFAGKLVPQDPNDEPASVFLERIAEERKERTRLGASARDAARKAKPTKTTKTKTPSKRVAIKKHAKGTR